MNEKLTVLAVNGESYDIWDESAVKTYQFASLQNAVAAMNSDTFTGEKPETAAVSVIRFGPGAYRVDLLTDLTETQPAEITGSVELHLNGKALVFNISQSSSSAIKLSGDGVCTVDGQVAGSTFRRIVAAEDTAGTIRHGIHVAGKKLILKGGTYQVEGYSEVTKSSAVIALQSGSMEAAGCTFVSSGLAINNRYCITAAGEKENIFTDCVFQLDDTMGTGTPMAYYMQRGKHKLHRCEINTASDGGYGVYANDSDVVVSDSTINATDQENGGIGIRCSDGTVSISNTYVNTNGQTSGGIGVWITESTASLADVTINTTGQASGGIGVWITESTASLADVTINTTGQTSGGVGIQAMNSVLKTDNVDVRTNGLTSGGTGLCANNCTVEACHTKAVCNCPINTGVGMNLIGTTAFMTKCYANAGHTGIQVNPGSNLYFRDGLIRGFTHGLYCTHSPENECYIKDSTLECRNNEDIPLCIDTPNVHKCCCYIGLYENVGQTTHFDGCTFKSGNDEMSIDEAVVLRANDAQETETAACMSNCVILLSDPTPFRLEAGKSVVNIGVNTVDGSGNPITQAKVHPGTGGVDSVPENLHVTGLLYRKLADGECCTGKDIKAFTDYYTALMAAD